MISKINATPLKDLPDSRLHEQMFYLQNDVDDYLSQESIDLKIEDFKNTMLTTQGVSVTTTHRNSLIQAEIETKEEYLRLNQGSGESVLDMGEGRAGREGLSGLINNEDDDYEINNNVDLKMNNINSNNQNKNNKNNNNDDNNKNDDTNSRNLKMKSKFEGMKGYVKPKNVEKERKPDKDSKLDDVKNSISVKWLQENSNGNDDENENEDEINESNENSLEHGVNGENGENGEDEIGDNGRMSSGKSARSDMIESKKDSDERKKEVRERLEKIAAMKDKGYLIGWG